MDATFVWKLAKLGRLGSSHIRYDDDFIDRLNYQITGVMLFLFIGIIGIRQYVGKPIQCWSPQEFTRGWEEYAENFCWVANTYYAPLKERLPNEHKRTKLQISYYQWAWIFMGVQALLFYLPCLIWRGLYPQSRFNVRRIMQMANAATDLFLPLSGSEKSTHSSSGVGPQTGTIRFIAKYIDTCIRRRHAGRPSRVKNLNNNNSNNNNNASPNNPSTMLKSAIAMTTDGTEGNGNHGNGASSSTASVHGCCGHRAGNCLALLYLMVKLLYLINSIFQIYLMEVFIGTKYVLYGIYILFDLVKGSYWGDSGHFPRVTFCDFEAKKLGKNHLYTLQCVLPINMILEKVFIILWFWVCLLAGANALSLMAWSLRLLQSRLRLRFVRRHLHIASSGGALAPHDRPLSRTFVDGYLGADGVFLLRLVAANSCEFVASQLAHELWTVFRHRRHQELEEMKFGLSPSGGGGSSLSPTAPTSGGHHKSSSKLVGYANSNRYVVPLPVGINHDDIV